MPQKKYVDSELCFRVKEKYANGILNIIYMQKKINLGRILTLPFIVSSLIFTTAVSLHALESIYGSQSVTLYWDSQGVTNCTASNNYTPNTSIWSGAKAVAGNVVWGGGTFNQSGTNTYTFRVTCLDSGGSQVTNSTDLQVSKDPVIQLQLGSIGSSNPFVTLDLAADSYYVSSGRQTTIRWNFPVANGSCTASGDWSGSKPVSGTSLTLTNTTYFDVSRTYNLSCTGAGQTLPRSISITFQAKPEPADPGCFIAGTKVLMADGSKKNIEDITLDDHLMTSGGPQEVMKTYRIAYKGKLYAFNNSGNYFVSPTHPFMTTEGWKSLDPAGTRRESPGIQVSKLEVGDNLVLHGNKYMTLTALDSVSTSTTVYNFGINGTHDYYADDYLVHNVSMTDIFEKAYALQAK